MGNSPDLKVLVTADATSAMDALEKFSSSLKGMASQVAGEMASLAAGVESALGVFSNPVTTIAGALGLGAAIHEVTSFVEESIESTNKLAEAYKNLKITAGLSVEEFNQMTAAAQLSGGSVGDVTALVGGMEKGIKRNTDVLVQNGIAASEVALSHMSLGDYIKKVVEVMNTYGSATEKDQLLMAAFGRGGMEFAALLVEMNKNMAQAKDLTKDGGIINEKSIENLERYEQSIGKYNLALQRYKSEVADSASSWVDMWRGFKTFALNVDSDQSLVNRFVSNGLVQYKLLADGVNADNKSMLDSVHKLLEAWRQAAEQSKDYMDVGTKSGFRELPTASFKPKAKKPVDTEFEKLKAQLEAKRFNYEQETALMGEYHQFTKTQEETFWADQLAKGINSDKAKAKAKQAYYQAAHAALMQDQKDTEAVTEERNKAALAKQMAVLAEEGAAADEAHKLQMISDQEYLNWKVDIENRKYQIELDALNKSLIVGQKTVVEMAKIRSQIEALESAHSQKMQAFAYQQVELTQQGNAWAGWVSGLKQALKEGQNAFEVFKSAATSVINGVENAFSTGIQGLLSGQMSLGQAMKSIWQGIVSTVIQAAAQIIARWIVMSVVGKALTMGELVQSGAKTAGYITEGAAGAWAAYGWMPVIGAMLAEAQIALMLASIAGAGSAAEAVSNPFMATALAVGGRIDQPTLALMGEAGPEIVAPEASFKDYTRAILSLGANLGANLSAADAQVAGYGRQGASYARAMPAGGGQSSDGMAPVTIHVAMNGTILDSSQRGLRELGSLIIDGARAAGRERGMVLVPGQVFGGL